jgi:hypothetical protein
MLRVDVVGMVGATRAGIASGYLAAELELVRRREHVGDIPR